MIVFLLSWAITIRGSNEISDSRIGCQTLCFPRTQVENAEYGALRDAGVKWVRLGMPWSDCEGDTGVYSFDHMDWIVDTLNSLDIEVFICIGGNNPFYSAVSPTPSDPYYFSRYLAFVDTAAARFGDRVKVWEAWNEANIDGVWIPYDPAAYAATACSTAARIKARVPDAFCVLTGTALIDIPFIRACLIAGAGNYFDAVAFHPYRAWPEIDQEICTVWYPNPDFASPYNSYRDEIEALRDTVEKYAPGLVLWDTRGRLPFRYHKLVPLQPRWPANGLHGNDPGEIPCKALHTEPGPRHRDDHMDIRLGFLLPIREHGPGDLDNRLQG